jgi:hypothetical protein
VVDRIEIFKQVLSDSNASRDDRIEALKFLVHFVGEVHQPFHAIGEAAGGNGIAVAEFGRTQYERHPCNLHGAWDSGLIQRTGRGRDEYVSHLEKLISDEHLIASGNPADWANESHGYALSAWLADGAQIDENYYRKEIKVVDQRLALAGLRLALLLPVQGRRSELASEKVPCDRSGSTQASEPLLEDCRVECSHVLGRRRPTFFLAEAHRL